MKRCLSGIKGVHLDDRLDRGSWVARSTTCCASIEASERREDQHHGHEDRRNAPIDRSRRVTSGARKRLSKLRATA